MEFQLVQAPFRFGVDEGVDPNQQPPGRLVTCENAEWTKTMRLQKRRGTTFLSRQTTQSLQVGAGTRLFTRGSELCCSDGTALYSYSSSLSMWKRIGYAPEVGLSWENSVDPTVGVASVDVATTTNGFTAVAWVAGDPTVTIAAGAVYAQVTDTDTGASFIPATVLASSGIVRVRALAIGDFIIIVALTSAGVIEAWLLDPSDGSVAGPTSLRTDALVAGLAFDAMVLGSNFVIAYGAAAGNAKLYSYDVNLVQQATGTIVEANTPNVSLSIDGALGESLYVAYVDALGATRIAVANPSTLAQTVAPVTVEATTSTQGVTVCRLNSTNCVVAYTNNDLVCRTVSVKVSNAGAVDANSTRGTWAARLASKPFVLNSRMYMMLADRQGTIASSFAGVNSYLVEVETSSKGALANYVPHRYVGCVDTLVGAYPVVGALPRTVGVSSTEQLVPMLYLASAPTRTTVWRCGVRLVSVTRSTSLPADHFRPVTYGQETYLAGPVLSAYDGRSLFDYGYAQRPYIYTISTTSPAGSMGAGTYLYSTHLEYRSAAGVLHRGPTTTVAIAVAAAGQVVTTWTSYHVTSKHDATNGFGTATAFRTALVAHRSIAGGNNYFRLTYEPTYNVTYADQQANTSVLTDQRADTDIDGSGTDLNTRPLLYTSGGILDDCQPPAFLTLLLHRSRLWGLAGDGRTWWFSKSFQDDLGVAPGFHPNLRIVHDRECTAAASMDEKLVFFYADGLSYLLGDGPAPTGLGSDFAAPVGLQTDVGCTNPRSVVSTPDGVMFQSAKGIYLLSRGLEVLWLGRAVQDQLASYPNITSAVLVSKRNQVRFTCNNTAGTNGIVLVYDLVEKQWSTFKYYDTITATASCPIADACLWNDVWTALTPGGAVFYETSTGSTMYLDGGSQWVTLTLETAWMSAAGPLAFQSVRRFALHGVSNSNHDLAVSVGFDRTASYQQGPQAFVAGGSTTTVGPLEACEIHIGNRRKCSSIRFKIQDATPTSPGTYPVGTGQGPSFDTMGIEVGLKRSFEKKPAGKRG